MNNKGTKGQSFGTDWPDMLKVVVPAEIEALARTAVDSALAVHRELGPGLLENAYEACLAYELSCRGVNYQKQLPVPLEYRGIRIEVGFRANLLLDSKLLLELKAIDTILPLHRAQIVTYLKVLKLPLGLLINFNSVLIKDGIERILNVPRIRP